MAYENISGVAVTYLDGAFAIPRASTQQKILVVGPAEKGRTNEIYNVTNVSLAEVEFGASTEVMKAVHEAVAQGANNVSVIRSGGRQGSWVFTDSAGKTLTIVPEYRDDNVLGRYQLVIENDNVENRYIIFDSVAAEFVYDSYEVLALDSGVVTVTDTGIDLFTLGNQYDMDVTPFLDSVVTGDFTADGTATASSVSATEGSDGISTSLVERYAALNTTYHLLDYRDADFVIPTGIFVDEVNVRDDTNHAAAGTGTSDGDKYGYYWKGLPEAGSVTDVLGYVWEYQYKGRIYTYFSDVDDYVAGLGSDAAATMTVQTDFTLTAQKNGKGGNAVSLTITVSGSGSPTVSIVETDFGFDISVATGTSTSITDVRAAINTALNAFNLSTGVTAGSLVQAAGTSATSVTAKTKTFLSGGSGGAVLTPQHLTGDAVPSAVNTRFGEAVDAEFREVNFAHQLASFCHVASVSWSNMLGGISFKAPTGYSASAIADWIGVPPEYVDDGVSMYIDSPSGNGSGVLGHRLISGESRTSEGYRSSKVQNGNSTDGYAFGGFILTKGSSLPNGTSYPYGISDADEALDAGGKPIDLGKYLFITYDWPILNNGYNGGSSYRGSLVGTLFGKVVTLPENEDPIGVNGLVAAAQNATRVHFSQINSLSKARIIGLRREPLTDQLSFSSAKTMAHPDSDYTRMSTIRCVNRMLRGIRSLARPYIGKPYSAQTLSALQAAIDGYIVSERTAGVHQGALSRIEYSRQDKIMGRLTIKLRMVPPFSIEYVDVQTSLAADESEL
jgi:hypothetical protein